MSFLLAGSGSSNPVLFTLAIGLIWGHLHVFQYEEAYQLAQGCLCFEQRFAAAFFPVKSVECLKLDVERKQWLDRLAQRVELRPRRLHAFQLAGDPLGVAMKGGLFFLGDRDLRKELGRLLALPLHHLPPWFHRASSIPA